jgi:hypothetical protein
MPMFKKITHHKISLAGLCALVTFFWTASAFADADEGEYLGYRLGDKFEAPRGKDSREHIMGALIYDLKPVNQEHYVEALSLYVSPTSSIIGSIFGEWYFSSKRAAEQFADRYLATLGKKYDHWTPSGRSLTHEDYQLWVEIEKKPPIVEHWSSQKKYRVAIGLIYTPESLGRNEWMAIVYMEANNLALTASQ